MRAVACLVVVLVGCARSQAPTVRPDPSGSASAAPSAMVAPPSSVVVSAKSLGMWRGKPPLKIHYFDVSLRNPASEARWIVLPDFFPYEHDTEPVPGGALAELQVFRLAERPRVVMVKGVGGNFWAVRLPAHGDVQLRRLGVESSWENVPASVELEAIVASEVLVDGVPLATVSGGDVTSESGADVQAPRDAADPRALRFWHPDGGRSAPLKIVVESRSRTKVALKTDWVSP